MVTAYLEIQLVRDDMDQHTGSDDPPPAPDEIRRQLVWELVPARRQRAPIDQD